MSRQQSKRRYRHRRMQRYIERQLDYCERLLGKRPGESSDAFMDRQMSQIMMDHARKTRPPLCWDPRGGWY